MKTLVCPSRNDDSHPTICWGETTQVKLFAFFMFLDEIVNERIATGIIHRKCQNNFSISFNSPSITKLFSTLISSIASNKYK